MATYKQRAGGKWQARIRIAPFPTETKGSFPTKRRAQIWAQEREAELMKKKHAGLLEEEIYTWADLIDNYLDTKLSSRGSDRKSFQKMALWWRAEIGHMTLAETRPMDLGERRDALSKEPAYSVDIKGNRTERKDKKTGKLKRLEKSTVKKYLSTLSAICTHNIMKKGWLKSNPVHALSKHEAIEGNKKREKERVRFLSDIEKHALLTNCKASDSDLLYPIVLFALCTGARKGEILNLKLSDFKASMRKVTLEDTKNGDRRTVHIPPLLRKCLKEHLQKTWRRSSQKETSKQWLFPRSNDKTPASFRRAWQQARKRAIRKTPSLADFRFHDLRHTFASYLAMDGATLLQLKEALGHRTIKAVERYAHLTEDHTEELVMRMVEKRLEARDNAVSLVPMRPPVYGVQFGRTSGISIDNGCIEWSLQATVAA